MAERYEQINASSELLTENGTTILKFFLHISQGRAAAPLQGAPRRPAEALEVQRRATITERERWDDYMRAYEDALRRDQHAARRPGT